MTPLRFPPDLLLRAQGPGDGIRAAVFDVDGVLTDGSIWVSAEGESIKPFHVQDGQGLMLLGRGGIAPIVVTGRDSPAVRRRIADLGLPHASYGISDKLGCVEDWLARLGLGWDTLAVIGDDWPDLPLFARAGFACAPADAHPEAIAAAHHVTQRAGGRGAAREFCDLLLTASGRYAALLAGVSRTLDAR
jgi:3-deoxy-D-manno-octulosonate 8-phosphate phosphatase (KDO 8-P phosphatase)